MRYLSVPRELSRAEVQKLEDMAKPWGAKGLAYIVFREDGEVASPIAKFLSEPELDAFREPGTTALFVADTPKLASKVLGLLRLHLGRELDLIDRDAWEFLWITPMPLLEWNEDENRWTAQHHPFTRPTDDSLPLLEDDPGAASAVAYDLVGNGIELAGGSIRIHEPELQARMFDFLGISAEEQRAKFGFLLDALAMGAPPHGGHRLRDRPPHDGAPRRAGHPRHGRLPEEPGGRRPDERGSCRCGRRPAGGARAAAKARGGESRMSRHT